MSLIGGGRMVREDAGDRYDWFFKSGYLAMNEKVTIDLDALALFDRPECD